MPSEREQVATDLADTCVFGNMVKSYDRLMQKVEENGKSFWRVSFARDRLEGYIIVNTPRSIVIKWKTSDPKLPKSGTEHCKSGRDAKWFLQRFVEV